MVDDEVVQDDDAWPPTQRVDDPRVRVGVVADVVERDVRISDGPGSSGAHDVDVEQALERRKQERRVVRDARCRGRKR